METVRQPFFPLVMICQLELTNEKFLPSRPCSFRNPIFRIPMGRTIYLPIPAAARCNEGAAPQTHHGWMQLSSNSRIDGHGWGRWNRREIGGEKSEAHQDVIAFVYRKFHEFRYVEMSFWNCERRGRCLLHVGWRMLKIMLMLFLCFCPAWISPYPSQVLCTLFATRKAHEEEMCGFHEWLKEPGICETCGKLLHPPTRSR